ncbi:hypothetical protein CK203_074330 [Vitis vinifera]|uniref:Uncharacterized protein n=1 Tax=Vitis vinifera TaxID=29760 RepID=A0A438BYL9_VITVI|nr:hypothetical protein CK203_074330 [Vitis vinifera]
MLEPQLVEGSAMISINSSGKEVISSNGGQMTSTDEKTGFVSGEKAQFSKEENDRLKSLLETLEEPSSLCFSAESGATDHMTCSSHKFSSYNPVLATKRLQLQRSLATVACQGEIRLGYGGLGYKDNDWTC